MRRSKNVEPHIYLAKSNQWRGDWFIPAYEVDDRGCRHETSSRYLRSGLSAN